MVKLPVPELVPNWLDGREVPASGGGSFDKLSPATGEVLFRVTRSDETDVKAAVEGAEAAQAAWDDVPPVKRGQILADIAYLLRERREEMASVVAAETGKSHKDSLGETEGAFQCGMFFAGEGQRMYARTTTSGTPNKSAMTIRRPVGVAGLIIAANTPIANVAWKVFPALICGNAALLKAAEDTPATAWLFGKIAQEAGLPPGVLQIINGYGAEAGRALVGHPSVGVVSFTGSTGVGREIAEIAGKRLAKISLELGGKNPFVVCDDADLDKAVHWAILSAFSNAGQRCASGSRLIVTSGVYEDFRDRLVAKTNELKVGASDDDDFGPVINERQLTNMTRAVKEAAERGARVLCGGDRLTDDAHAGGFYMAPTLVEDVEPHDPVSTAELFGPIACLYRADDYADALRMANDSPYGLTACIHTRSVDRALDFSRRVEAGAVVVNAGTFGSEPHMPFGGVKQSGNGSREPGTEALDIYSELKDVYLNADPEAL
jgi:alpha-ketoglutaric semialdehyde dehydrogenase